MFNPNTEERIKHLEEEIMYLQRDLGLLQSIVQDLKPIEFHEHYTKIITCSECKQK
jgi:hypothetical protein